MKNFMIALRISIVLTVLTGIVYPLLVTGVAKVGFASKADGSLVSHGGAVVGSELIAQKFQKGNYFWPRPSAIDYNGTNSGASNLSVTSEALNKTINERKAAGLGHDLAYASGSGLDPHISPEAAVEQVDRVVQTRHLSAQQRDLVLSLISDYTEGRQWGFLGEPRVNVLKLNIALDEKL